MRACVDSIRGVGSAWASNQPAVDSLSATCGSSVPTARPNAGARLTTDPRRAQLNHAGLSHLIRGWSKRRNARRVAGRTDGHV
jgi:hypothetical protein